MKPDKSSGFFVISGSFDRKKIPDILKEALNKNLTLLLSIDDKDAHEINNVIFLANYLKRNSIPFLVHNDLMLALITESSGILLDEKPENPEKIKRLLGPETVISTVQNYKSTSFFPGFKKEKVKFEEAWNDEFGLIKKLIKEFRFSEKILIPPGVDDCSLLKSIRNPVITTDTQRENQHFKREWQTPFEIGFKAVTITLSDLAASFAEPVAVFINLALPPDLSESYLKDLYSGVNEALNIYNCALGGGNISSGREFSIDLFAVGECISDIYPKRGNAMVGEFLFCTGFLGEASAGLELLINRKRDENLVSRFIKPRARFDIVNTLIKNGVKCSTDISDGLSGDSLHITKASDVSIEFLPENIPVSEDLLRYCSGNSEKALQYIFSGGEDYELLFTATEENFSKITSSGFPVYKVGKIIERKDKYLINIPDGVKSFNHGEAL